MTATLPGPLQRTNKLLSISPLRARYTPSIGDLVIGRIVSVDKSRWRVDIAAPLLAHLPLSSINLPGGVLRRRTTADELQMRSYFQEGDLVIAEVQGVGNQDGVAGLHTRSLRYGKLRDGIFVAVAGGGGGGGGGATKGVGVVRGKRQVFTIHTANGGGEVDVALGVNGFVWVSGHLDPQEEAAQVVEKRQKEKKGKTGVSISNLDEMVSNEIYSSQNHDVGMATRREIARLCASITLLAEAGCRVDEESVIKAYRAAVEADMEMMVDEGEDVGGWPEVKALLTKRIVQAVVGGG
jgi:exosome complex component RRP4